MTENCIEVINAAGNGQWYSPLAIFISAFIGASVAILSLKAHRDIARKRATLDVILKSESDEYFERIYKVFASEKDRSGGLQALLSAETVTEKGAKTEVDNFLNHYELIAISIEQEILDEGFYKAWMKTTYVNHYEQASG